MRRSRPMVAGALLTALIAGCGLPVPGRGPDVDCGPYEAYGRHPGSRVTIASSIRGLGAQQYIDALAPFRACTGIAIDWNGSGSFETDLPRDLRAGHGPDLAALPQPGLLQQLVASGDARPAPPDVTAAAGRDFPEQWLRYGTVGGTFYATPLGVNVKSLVWYSPSTFRQYGLQVPKTWDELMALTERAARGTGSGPHLHPWCDGIESGVATGWPATDWVEDVLLRFQPPGVYDDWVAHRIPFDDPRIVAAIDRVGSILRNPRYVNGGFGGVGSIATTAFQDGGLPIVDSGECLLHRGASVLAGEWPVSIDVGENGDVYAFYLPPAKPGTEPVLVAGEFLAAFDDRPETVAVQRYLSSPGFANRKARLGQWISPIRGLDRTNVDGPVDRLSLEILNRPDAVVRFDGSDMMPAAVGAGSFWREMTSWITSGRSSRSVASAVEASWP